jgi:hypothetical protein
MDSGALDTYKVIITNNPLTLFCIESKPFPPFVISPGVNNYIISLIKVQQGGGYVGFLIETLIIVVMISKESLLSFPSASSLYGI